jgi:F-type H+-transporting ATPase subunit epsilon
MATAERRETINFELVSPEAKLMSGPVKMAVIPGEDGELGVGAGHSSFIVSLKPGVVQLFNNDNEAPRKIFITGGFADITNENCTVLAEQAVDVSTINAAATEQEIKTLEVSLASAQEPADITRFNRQLGLAKAKLGAVTGKIVL